MYCVQFRFNSCPFHLYSFNAVYRYAAACLHALRANGLVQHPSKLSTGRAYPSMGPTKSSRLRSLRDPGVPSQDSHPLCRTQLASSEQLLECGL